MLRRRASAQGLYGAQRVRSSCAGLEPDAGCMLYDALY